MPESNNERALGQSGRSIRVRFGSADSRDIDVLYTVESLPDPVECKAFCSNAAENRNLAVIRKGIISETYKGLPDETNNAILATWSLHLRMLQTLFCNPSSESCRSRSCVQLE